MERFAAIDSDGSGLLTASEYLIWALRDTLATRYNSGRYTLPAPPAAEWAGLRRFFAPYNSQLAAWLRDTDDGTNTAFDLWQT